MAQFLSNPLNIVRPLTQSFQRAKAKLSSACTAATFACGNAESTSFPGKSFDLVTIMYAFHEAPKAGRENMLREAHRLLGPGGTLAVIDIHSDFKPPQSMLLGEPYGT